jgi:2'-5' RNA ligase
LEVGQLKGLVVDSKRKLDRDVSNGHPEIDYRVPSDWDEKGKPDPVETDHHKAPKNKNSVRAFVAIALEADARSALTRASALLQREPWAEGVRWVPAGNLHLTLRFLGEIAEATVPELMDALGARLRNVEPFGCALDGVSLFPTRARPRAISAGLTEVHQLEELALVVEEAVVSAGHAPETRGFRAHITLGRLRRRAERKIELAVELEQTAVSVREVVLYRSTLDPGGARYSVLGRTALGTRGGSRSNPGPSN